LHAVSMPHSPLTHKRGCSLPDGTVFLLHFMLPAFDSCGVISLNKMMLVMDKQHAHGSAACLFFDISSAGICP
jgi:hypothetical protein